MKFHIGYVLLLLPLSGRASSTSKIERAYGLDRLRSQTQKTINHLNRQLKQSTHPPQLLHTNQAPPVHKQSSSSLGLHNNSTRRCNQFFVLSLLATVSGLAIYDGSGLADYALCLLIPLLATVPIHYPFRNNPKPTQTPNPAISPIEPAHAFGRLLKRKRLEQQRAILTLLTNREHGPAIVDITTLNKALAQQDKQYADSLDNETLSLYFSDFKTAKLVRQLIQTHDQIRRGIVPEQSCIPVTRFVDWDGKPASRPEPQCNHIGNS